MLRIESSLENRETSRCFFELFVNYGKFLTSESRKASMFNHICDLYIISSFFTGESFQNTYLGSLAGLGR